MVAEKFSMKGSFGCLILFSFLAVFAVYSSGVNAFTCAQLPSSADRLCQYSEGCTYSAGSCSGSTLTCTQIEKLGQPPGMVKGEMCTNAYFVTNQSLNCYWVPSNLSCVDSTGQGGNITGFSDPCHAFTTNATCSARNAQGCFYAVDMYATGGASCLFMCQDPANKTLVAQNNCTAASSLGGMNCQWTTQTGNTTPAMCKWGYGSGTGGGPMAASGCAQFDGTSEQQCTVNTVGLQCTWTSGMNLCDPAAGTYQNCNSWCGGCTSQNACDTSPSMCRWNSAAGGFCENKYFMPGMGGSCNNSCYNCFDTYSCSSSGAGCSWVSDTFAASGGHCDPATYAANFNCSAKASACTTPQLCNASSIAGGAYWNSTSQICMANGTTPEICFLPGDEDFDGKVNCIDSDCYTDPACGYGMSMGGGGGGMGVAGMGLGAINPEVCFAHDKIRGGNQAACENQNGTAGTAMVNTSVCYWHVMATGADLSDGICDPKFMQQMMFGAGTPTMMGGPTPIGEDKTEAGVSEWLDIRRVGIMDTPQTINIGIPVKNITNLAGCGKILPASLNQTGKYYRYIDINKNVVDGCTGADENGTIRTGFEYKIVYESAGNYSNENTTAYRCLNSAWVPYAATISVVKDSCYADPFMISEGLGGVQVLMVKKADIGNPTNDIRIMVTTASATTNDTNPVDSAGPYYYTPGTIDFKPNDCFVDPSKCSVAFQPPAGGMGGFMMFEDCGPMAAQKTVDLDKDGYFGCDDTDCAFNPWCQSTGNYSAATDTKFPTVIMSKVDEFKDSAMVTWHTDEPATGMVVFYGLNNSCLNQLTNASQFDDPISTFDDYRPFHDVWIDNTSLGTVVPGTGANLTPNQTYFYKLRSCDRATPQAHCAISGCLNFTTLVSDPTMKFKFAFTPPLGSGATDFMGGMGYFFDTGGGYQAVNFDTAKTMNKTSNVTIKLNNPNLVGTGKDWEIELLEAKLTTDKQINFSSIVNVTNRTDTGCSGCTYVGMTNKSAWDEMYQGLNVQKINVTIPGSNPTHTVYKCTDYQYNSTNCQNITPNISCTFGNASTECTMPAALGFSAYVTATTAAAASAGESPGSGGGAGGAGGATAFTLPAAVLEKSFSVSTGDSIIVDFGIPTGGKTAEKYTVKIVSISGTLVTLDIK